VACILHLSLESKFEPLYGVRGKIPSDLGTPKLPQWEKDTLWFRYAGTDRLFRALAITMMPAPHGKEKTSARYAVRLAPNESQQIDLTFRIREEPEAANIAVSNHTAPPFAEVLSRRRSDRTNWERTVTIPHCDNPIVNQTLRRCLDDVRMLTMTMEGQRVMAAGIPWFVGLFGRDSLIASLELQAFAPALSAGDLRLLARYQGQKNTGPPSDEQPGKILHELRVGEGARSHHIPHTPYYGSIDSTLWYVIALVRYVDWTGDVDLFHELRPHLEAALTWMDLFGDRHGEDFVSYSSDPADQLANKGWKDSSEAIVNADGSQAHPPIALVAAQGYIYHGKQLVAALYDRIGERAVAERMRRESARLRERFNAAFWIPAINFYALALQQHQKPAAVVSSNPGQALWTGIVDEDKAKQVASRVMEPDMFTGWGIRTLSSLERGYSPISYERGSVWPFDTAFIGAGLRRYGFDEAACRLFDGLVAAASYFDWYRLPELFCGFSREEYHVPIPNPKAEHPQAWSAGSVPYLLTELLGFRPSALDHRLDLVRPVLPASIQRLEFGRLRVGAAHVDLSFTRRSDGRADVKVAKVDGSLDVQVTP
jgi:glycogen debranching enzyme